MQGEKQNQTHDSQIETYMLARNVAAGSGLHSGSPYFEGWGSPGEGRPHVLETVSAVHLKGPWLSSTGSPQVKGLLPGASKASFHPRLLYGASTPSSPLP